MKVYLTGWDGFLARKLRETDAHEWTDNINEADVIFFLGSPTFTESKITRCRGLAMHDYVQQISDMIWHTNIPVIFASTTGVDDIELDHSGSTVYNLCKLYIENYIMHNSEDYLILRIGTIISDKKSDIDMMKPDRIQPRLLRGEFKDIPKEDEYLHVDTFVSQTNEAINNINNSIFEYDLEHHSMFDLIKMAK